MIRLVPASGRGFFCGVKFDNSIELLNNRFLFYTKNSQLLTARTIFAQ